MMLLVTICWVLSTHFLKSTYTGIFYNSPFNIVPFSRKWFSELPYNASTGLGDGGYSGGKQKQTNESSAAEVSEREVYHLLL
jgi:hypothetical protein